MPRRRARGAGPMRGRTVRTPPYGTGRPPRHRQCMASAALPGQRGGGGLQSPARDHEAELWRAQVVVHLPDRAPRRRSAATGSEVYLPSGSKYFGSREAYGLTYTSCQESGPCTDVLCGGGVRANYGGGRRPRGPRITVGDDDPEERAYAARSRQSGRTSSYRGVVAGAGAIGLDRLPERGD